MKEHHQTVQLFQAFPLHSWRERIAFRCLAGLLAACTVLTSTVFGQNAGGLIALAAPRTTNPVMDDATHTMEAQTDTDSAKRPIMKAEVRMDRAVYSDGMGITATVTLMPGISAPRDPHLVFAGSASKDVEVASLRETAPGVFTTTAPIPINSGSVRPGDGTMSLAPNEMFFALFSFRQGERPDATLASAAGSGDLASAFALMADGNFKDAPVQILPELAMTPDERQVPPGGKHVGTLASANAPPVQVPIDELIFYPRDDLQLKQFLEISGGQIVMEGAKGNGGQANRSLLIKVDPAQADVEHLPQLRALFQEKDTLLASTVDALRIYSLAMQYKIQGFVVGVNPRLQIMSTPSTQDGAPGPALDAFSADGSVSPAIFSDPLFGVQKAWAYVALWDRDAQRIPIAFLDEGFAPNWDFRGFPGAIPERNLESGRSGPGSAEGPPTVGASFTGSLMWHGNGVVTTAAGVLNNGYGGVGTGGQVGVPMLYETGLRSYAFEMGTGIHLATDDGANIVNISAGYPCTIVTNVGLDFRVCSPAARLALCGLVTAALHLAAAAAFAIPFAGLVLGPIALAAADTATAACLALILLGDPRGPMEEAVEYARLHGVTVVSISGNAQSRASLGAIADFVPTGTQDVSRWEVVPGVIPGVICAGAADATSPYANNQYFGNRVDVWAPVGFTGTGTGNVGAVFFTPPTTSAVTAPESQTRNNDFNGTSAAAPFLAGVIAMMQAVNPSLDRRNRSLTAAQLAAIPQRIRSILVSTATPASALPTGPSPEVARRRNMVNAFAAVRAAAQGVTPNFDPDAAGYDTSLNLDRDPSHRHDTLEHAQPVDAISGGTFTGTILTIPQGEGPGGATTTNEVFYSWNTPRDGGVYDGGSIQLTQPRSDQWGELRINDSAVPLVSRLPGDHEEVRVFTIPAQFGGASVPIKISGFGGSDNVYKVQFHPAHRIGDAPQPDRFDRPEANPPGRPNNDTAGRAVPQGGDDEFRWQPGTSSTSSLVETQQIAIPDLTFHRTGDQDWFSLSVPAGWDPATANCPPTLTIVTGPGVTTEVHGRDGSLIRRSSDARIILTYRQFHGRFPLNVMLSSTSGGPVTYSLQFLWSAMSAEACAAQQAFQQIRYIDYPTGSFHIYDPGDPAWRAQDLVRNFALDWKGGDFTLQGSFAPGHEMTMRLLNQKREVVTQTLSEGESSQVKSNVFHPGGANLKDLAPGTLLLSAKNLAAGTYVLEVNPGKTATPLDVRLPQNAITDSTSISLEALTVPNPGNGRHLLPAPWSPGQEASDRQSSSSNQPSAEQPPTQAPPGSTILLPDQAFSGGVLTGVVIGPDDQPVANTPVQIADGGVPSTLSGEVIGDQPDQPSQPSSGEKADAGKQPMPGGEKTGQVEAGKHPNPLTQCADNLKKLASQGKTAIHQEINAPGATNVAGDLRNTIQTDALGRFQVCVLPDTPKVAVNLPAQPNSPAAKPIETLVEKAAYPTPQPPFPQPPDFVQPDQKFTLTGIFPKGGFEQNGKQGNVPVATAVSADGSRSISTFKAPHNLQPGPVKWTLTSPNGKQSTFNGGIFKIVRASLDRSKLRSNEGADFEYEILVTPEMVPNGLCADVKLLGPITMVQPPATQILIDASGHGKLGGKIRATPVAPGSTVPFDIQTSFHKCSNQH